MTFHRVESLVRVISLPCQGQEVVRRAGGCVHLTIGIINIINIRNIVIIMIILIIPTKFDKRLLPEDQICSSKGRIRSKYCLIRNSFWYFVFELLLCILRSEKFPSSSPSLSS